MSPPCPDDTPVPKSCRSNGEDGRPPRSQHRRAGAVFAVLALAIVSCNGGAEPEAGPEPPTTPPADPASEPSPATTGPAAAPEPDDASPEPTQPEETSPPAEPEEPEEPAPEFPPPPNPPPVNPFLADSAVPMPHGDAGQTDWSSVAGPAGPADSGNSVELTYRHLGPGHFGIAISSPYPDGRRVIWSNGGDRISKLDHDTLEVLAEMNVVLFWRDEIPDGWEQLPGTPSRRIAGQLPALIGDPDRASIQTEQSVVTAGYGALVVNNDPASAPEGWSAVGNRVLVSYAGADPAFSPKGVQKFEWDPESRTFGEAWANTEVGSANAVPIVSADLRHVYTVGARRGQWTLEAIDFQSGESAFHWVTGSNRYNTLFSGMNLDQQGRIVHTTVFGIVRYDPTGN